MTKFMIDYRLHRFDVDDNGCWIWNGPTNNDGYATVWWNKDMMGAHRAMYEEYIDKVPKGLQLDHLCNVNNCVNLLHLEVVTASENMKRHWERKQRV